MVRTADSEKAASEWFGRWADPWFDLHKEVQLRHHDGTRLRIDYVGVPRVPFNGDMVGFEIKRGKFDGFKEYSQALKQAIDYRHAKIEDKRFPAWEGKIVPYVFLWFPDEEELTSSVYDGWRPGAERLAGKFNVGRVRAVRYRDDRDDLFPYMRLEISTHKVWDSLRGMTGFGERLTERRGGRGSAK